MPALSVSPLLRRSNSAVSQPASKSNTATVTLPASSQQQQRENRTRTVRFFIIICFICSFFSYQLGRNHGFLTSGMEGGSVEDLLLQIQQQKQENQPPNTNETLSESSNPQPVSNPQPETPQTQEKYAYTTSLHVGTKFMCGAAMLAWGLRNRRPDIDMAVFVSGFLGNNQEHETAINYMKRLGYKIKTSPLLINPFNFSDLERRFNFCKVNMYAMIDYTKVTYVDTDLFFPFEPPDHLFDQHEGSPKPAARIAWKKRGWINAGFMLARPNLTLYWDMLSRFHEFESNSGGDQGFQNIYFNKYQFGFDGYDDDYYPRLVNWIDLRRNKTMNPFLRDDLPPVWKYYHPFGMKPWMCPKGTYCERDDEAARTYIWPQMIDLWWEEFDKMVAAWPWVLEEPYRDYCIKPMPDVEYKIDRDEFWRQKKQMQQESEAMGGSLKPFLRPFKGKKKKNQKHYW